MVVCCCGAGLELVLLGEEGSLARCIPRGRSVVVPCREREGPACALLTLMGPATATFTGLRWNLGACSLGLHLSTWRHSSQIGRAM